jgi:serine/threonine protein kinase
MLLQQWPSMTSGLRATSTCTCTPHTQHAPTPAAMQAAVAVKAGFTTEITHSFDIWQFGMLMYEVHSSTPYWANHVTDGAILQCLLDSTQLLPHELRPVKSHGIQSILCRMLDRDIFQRLTAPQLEGIMRTELTKELPNHTMNTDDVYPDASREFVL